MGEAHSKRSKRCVLILAIFGVLASFTSGQSRLIFPRLSFEEGTLTGIALLNPNSTSASVTFAAYDDTGRLIEASGFENRRQIAIAAGLQFAEVIVELFGTGPADTVGWIEATSTSSDLTGFFLYLNLPDFTLFDGADLPRSNTQLVFPEVRLADGFSSETNLVNPSTEAATVQLTLQGGETPLTADTLEIPSLGVRRLDVEEVFAEILPAGAVAFPDPAIVSLTSTQAVAGFAFVRQPEGDLLGLNAVPADEQLNRLYFPQLAVGESIRTELSLDNLSAADTLVTLTARQEDGELFGSDEITTNPVSLPLEAGQVLRLDISDTFGFVGDQLRDGWLEVAATTQVLHGALSYTVPASKSLAAVATSAQGSRQAAFSHLATDLGFFTGVALLNSAALAADVRIVAIAADGQILGTATRTLAPGQRISQLLGVELIPQAAGQVGGAVYVRSSVPIYLTSLFGREGILANIPAQPVPSSYLPDQGLPQARLNPSLAAVEPDGSLQFMIEMGGAQIPSWKVNGMECSRQTSAGRGTGITAVGGLSGRTGEAVRGRTGRRGSIGRRKIRAGRGLGNPGCDLWGSHPGPRVSGRGCGEDNRLPAARWDRVATGGRPGHWADLSANRRGADQPGGDCRGPERSSGNRAGSPNGRSAGGRGRQVVEDCCRQAGRRSDSAPGASPGW